MSPDPKLSKSLESLLAAAVERKAAPGLSAVAFNRDGIFAQAATGDDGTGKALTLDTILWIASSGKLAVSLLTLIACEKHSLDIDSHDDLVKLVPELGKDHEGSKVYTIFDGKDEKGEWKFRKADEAAPGLTVRHLLAHTAGFDYFFNSEEGAWRMTQEGGSDLGSDKYLNVARVTEVDEKWGYNMGCDWLAVIIPRLTGLTLREAFKQYLLNPLGLDPHSIDTFRTPEMDAKRGGIMMRGEEGFIPLPFPFDTPQYDGTPPAGMNPLTSAPLWCSLLAFTTIIQSLLSEEGPKDADGKPLLSKKVFDEAHKDALIDSGKGADQYPFAESHLPIFAKPIKKWWMKPKEIKEGSRHPLGWSLLQTTVLREESATGLKPKTLSWSGLANTYYFIDREQGIGAVVSTQTFPWGQQEMMDLRDEVERWTVDNRP